MQNGKKGGQGGSKRRVGSRGLDKVLFLSLELDLRVRLRHLSFIVYKPGRLLI